MNREKSKIERLLRDGLQKSPDPAHHLISKLGHIKQQACFNKAEFLEMCRWKSPRPRRLYESNSSYAVRRISLIMFASNCEQRRIELLTSLKGVGLPTASAILTLTDPQVYGVIDVRVWQLLYRYGAVRTRPLGTGFTCKEWLEYLETLRRWAEEFDASVRDVERALFDYHKEHHKISS